MRTPNILVTNDLQCKVADFDLAINSGYPQITQKLEMYTALIPPECLNGQPFSTKGDVYVRR